MKSFNQHIDKDLNEKVKIDEATAGDFLLGLGAAGGLLALKKGWDKWGKGSKLAGALAFTAKGKAKVAQDKIDKEADKQKDKDTTADAAAMDYEKDEDGNIKNVKDAQAYKDKTDKAPSGWETSTGKGAFKKVKAGNVVQTKVADMLKKKYEAEREKGGQRIGVGAEPVPKKDDDKEESLTVYARDGLLKLTESDRQEVLKTLKGIMTITESNELQAIMALDDIGISAEINRKGEVAVKKKDLKKAQKALKKSFKKGGEPKLVGEGVLEDGTTEIVNQYKNDTPGQAGDDLIKVIEMQMSAAAKKKKDLWKRSAGGKASLKKSKVHAKKVASGTIKVDKAKGRAMSKERKKGGIRNEFELGEGLLTEALKPLDKAVIDAFYYKKEKEGKVVSTDGDSLWKNGLGGQEMAIWNGRKIKITGATDSKSTESILKYMKKSIPSGLLEGVQHQRTAYELVSEARKKAAANKPKWEQK